MQLAQVIRIPMSSPGDVSGLSELSESGKIRAEQIVAIVAKTEGNGCVNDFTRGYATFAFTVMLAEKLGLPREKVAERVAFIMSGGTEGVMAPHATIFAKREVEAIHTGQKRLAFSSTHTRNFLPDEIGRMPVVLETAAAVRRLMAEAGIDDPKDVHFVQIKCPLLTSERIDEAHRRGKDVVTEETYESMGYSRGASALGVALALGEISEGQLSDHDIMENWELYSSVASTSAGVELMNNEIILMGNSTSATGDLVIGHSVMKDAIDGEAVREALRQVGIRVEAVVHPEDAERIVNVFAKSEADPRGYVRGRRHTMLNDSDINSTRHARAVVSAVIASIVGDPMVYVSGGAEHQGPAGGGPVAAIGRVSS